MYASLFPDRGWDSGSIRHPFRKTLKTCRKLAGMGAEYRRNHLPDNFRNQCRIKPDYAINGHTQVKMLKIARRNAIVWVWLFIGGRGIFKRQALFGLIFRYSLTAIGRYRSQIHHSE